MLRNAQLGYKRHIFVAVETIFASTPATLLGLAPPKWFVYTGYTGQHTFASLVDLYS